MARPLKNLNWDLVIKRMEAGCNARSIAKQHNLEINTFYDRFKREFGCGFADYADGILECGDDDIKFVQHMKAIGGNVQMLMYLGKVRLKQKEEDANSSVPPNDAINQIERENMLLKAELAELKENGNKSQAG